MENVFKFINKWKSWILRAIVGAVIAIILGVIAGMHVWLVGAIIAVVSEIAVGYVTKPFNNLIATAETKFANKKSADADADESATKKKPSTKK